MMSSKLDLHMNYVEAPYALNSSSCHNRGWPLSENVLLSWHTLEQDFLQLGLVKYILCWSPYWLIVPFTFLWPCLKMFEKSQFKLHFSPGAHLPPLTKALERVRKWTLSSCKTWTWYSWKLWKKTAGRLWAEDVYSQSQCIVWVYSVCVDTYKVQMCV